MADFPAVLWNSAYRVWKQVHSFACLNGLSALSMLTALCVFVYKCLWCISEGDLCGVMSVLCIPQPPEKTVLDTNCQCGYQPMQINIQSNQPHNTGARAPLYMKVKVTWHTQVWWPILGICALHLTHPKCTHTPWTHLEQRAAIYAAAPRGAVGGSVPCSRAPQSGYWRWRECCTFTPPTYNSCRTWDSNQQPFTYESDSLTIRPRHPHSIYDTQIYTTV